VKTLEKKEARRVPITGRAGIYTRVSTSKQGENGASLEVQLSECRKYCENHGLQIVAEYKDVLSGLNTERPEYRKALVDKLVVWRLDRFGRDAAEYLGALKTLKKLGCEVVSTMQPTESSFLMGMLGLMAEEESKNISTRVLAARKHRFENGYWQSAAPLGYQLERLEGGGIVLAPHPIEAPIVTQLYQRYASGKHSLSDLRRYLNEHGIVKSRFSIWYVLKSRVYVGEIMHGRYSKSPFGPKPDVTYAQGKHPPLVDEATFARVQARLAANASRRRGGTAPKYLFSGLIRCGGCGRGYVGIKKPTKSGLKLLYRCGRKVSHGDCKSHSVHESVVKAAVIPPLEAVLGALSVDTLRAAVSETLTREAEAAEKATSNAHALLVANKERLEARLSHLEDGWLDGHISKERYLHRRDQIMGELAEIKERLSEHPAPVATDISGLLAMAESLSVGDLDDAAWRGIIEAVVERVEIKGVANKRRAAIVVKWRPGFESMKLLVEAMAS
jgi:site-specific DNA recombinase